ncbi:hypothetical protein K502DRAFT_316239 [Neoconidiobolus thromboides FSU 785]|nr:hypothetical protein K502DRAFT_316239 [Neoconidiobolus thromboides FSU 785]
MAVLDFEIKEYSNELSYKQFTKPIIKSSVDDREYRYIILNNDLTVLLISDPNGDKAAASLDIHVGSQNDPVELPGLAHFCEHLLFMGTEKYPKENDYSEYLAENAGYSNAYTSYDHTNYYFEVGPNHLEGALDRFSQFFTSSLFSPSCTEREIKAVDSENKKNLQEDDWRLLQLYKSFSKKDHPYSRFATGNLDTLLEEPKSKGIDTREELLKFYNKFYSSNIMKLVVSGKESLDKLTEWVIPRFSLVRNLNIEPPIHFDSPTPKEHFNSRIYVVPVKDARSLQLNFEIPPQTKLFDSKPTNILSQLIGHEGPGSILSLLKEKGWAISLEAGAVEDNPAFCFFAISIEVTSIGLENTDDIVLIVFQYIHLLLKEGVSKTYFDELKSIEDAEFKFRENFNVSSYVSLLSSILHSDCSPHEILYTPFVLKKYDPKLIMETLSYINPDRLVMLLVSKSFQERNDLVKERWYGTEYAIERISQTYINGLKTAEINSKLHLPKPNLFIPTNFGLSKLNGIAKKNPILLVNDKKGSLWYSRSEFNVPKSSIFLVLRNPFCYASPRHFSYLELIKDILIENLNEITYDAHLAGLSYSIHTTYNELNITVHGFNDKMETLLLEILNNIIKFKIDDVIFNNCKEKYLRELQNAKMNPPNALASYQLTCLLLEKVWSSEDKEKEVPTITSDKLMKFSNEFFSRAYVTSYINGNFNHKESIKIYNDIMALFDFKQLYPAEMISRRNVVLPGPNCSYVYQKKVPNPETTDSSIEFYLDIYTYNDLKKRVYSQFLGYIISEPAFNQLRTVEQLGYIVYGGAASEYSVGGISFTIQSEFNPIYLESRIEAFLDKYLNLLENYTDEEFQNKVQAFITIKLKKDDNIFEFAYNKWAPIDSGFYDFDEAESAVSILRNITKDNMIGFFKKYAIRGSSNRRKLSVHMVSQITKENDEKLENNFTLNDCGQLIDDIVDFKASNKLYIPPFPQASIPLWREE